MGKTGGHSSRGKIPACPLAVPARLCLAASEAAPCSFGNIEEETIMTTIPLNKLIPAPDNVRKTGAGDGIGELAASIAAHGLLQSLVVRKAKRGTFAVIAGPSSPPRADITGRRREDPR
jgi:ParB-like nuclease domain